MEFASTISPREAARQIADIIRKNPDRYNQESYFYIPALDDRSNRDVSLSVLRMPENTCGSTECVAGHALMLAAPPTYRFNSRGLLLYNDYGDDIGIDEYAMQVLDIDDDQSDWLFDALRCKCEVLWALDNIADGIGWEAYGEIPESYTDVCTTCH